MKKIIIIFLSIFLSLAAGYLIYKHNKPNSPAATSQCQVSQMTFYYLDQCQWCLKVKSEGTITKLENLGIKIKKVNANVGPIRHKFQGVPTFVIKNKVYSGYKTFEELKKLLGCP